MRIINFLLFLCIFLLEPPNRVCLEYKFIDALDELADTTAGAMKSMFSFPTKEEFFEMGKNTIFGYPMGAVFEFISEFCK